MVLSERCFLKEEISIAIIGIGDESCLILNQIYQNSDLSQIDLFAILNSPKMITSLGSFFTKKVFIESGFEVKDAKIEDFFLKNNFLFNDYKFIFLMVEVKDVYGVIICSTLTKILNNIGLFTTVVPYSSSRYNLDMVQKIEIKKLMTSGKLLLTPSIFKKETTTEPRFKFDKKIIDLNFKLTIRYLLDFLQCTPYSREKELFGVLSDSELITVFTGSSFDKHRIWSFLMQFRYFVQKIRVNLLKANATIVSIQLGKDEAIVKEINEVRQFFMEETKGGIDYVWVNRNQLRRSDEIKVSVLVLRKKYNF